MKKYLLKDLQSELLKAANPEKAKILSKFFKTEKGQYAEGDIFLGITVPVQRRIAKKYFSLQLNDIKKMLLSKFHEFRFVALIILCDIFNKSDEDEKKKIFNFYLDNLKYINNWDLVDISAPKILGEYLFDKDRSIIYKLACSESVWIKRIAILTTFAFIRKNQFDDAFKIIERLLQDSHDLIHKAAGWMLREIGKRDKEQEENFLRKNIQQMPRTMLRYAIEKFSEDERKKYLNQK